MKQTPEAQVEELRARLDELATSMQRMETEAVSDASQQVKEYIDRTTEALKEKWQTASSSAQETGQKVQRYAEDNPWKVAAIAAGVGVVVAALISASKRRD